MSISITLHCELLLYADDSTMMFSYNNLEFMSQKACKELELYSEWLRENKLSLQYIVVKLNAIILGEHENQST